MQAYLGLESLPGPLPGSVATLGKFLAVHLGHQALLQAAVREAVKRGLPSVALTFDRHPGEILAPEIPTPVLADLDERLALLEAQGVDLAVVIRLTPAFLLQEPEVFVEETLVGRLGVRVVLAGRTFRFGRGARGNLELLGRLGERLGFEVVPVPAVVYEGGPVSTSRIVKLIREGEVDVAARLLGRPYSLCGRVARGDGVGRRLGFPTANVVADPARLLPADGVYAARCTIPERTDLPDVGLPAVCNLGVRPTRGGTERLLEAHLPGWEGNLYEQRICVHFVRRLREERQFPDLETLRRQIARDTAQALRELSGNESGHDVGEGAG